jgi:hypothetical protein
MALRPGVLGMDWPEGFAVLEHEVARLAAELAAMPYARLVNAGPQDFPERSGPRFGQRAGTFYLIVDPSTDDDSVRVLLRAVFYFRWWPLGRWVVWEGFHATREGARTALSSEELQEVW